MQLRLGLRLSRTTAWAAAGLLVTTLASTISAQQLSFDPAQFINSFKLKPAPGTEGKEDKCTDGFFCPANTAQPLYCCAGYYCPKPDQIKICPKGKFCPRGSVEPQGCHSLASCPEGSASVSKFGVFALFLALVLVILVIFGIKKRKDTLKRVKYQHLLQYGYGAHDESANVDMGQVERTFDISFQDLGLVLPSGVEIMRGVTGELRSSRACAILGPSGAGKTTFVSLLTGKARRTSGRVQVNGTPEPLS
ncbi:hypothetical protein THASP1DRAFT_26286, partial [Thamnocephalis sphaerospora]